MRPSLGALNESFFSPSCLVKTVPDPIAVQLSFGFGPHWGLRFVVALAEDLRSSTAAASGSEGSACGDDHSGRHQGGK